MCVVIVILCLYHVCLHKMSISLSLGTARGISSGGLNERGLRRLRDLNTRFPVGGTVWGGLGGVALLGEVCL